MNRISSMARSLVLLGILIWSGVNTAHELKPIQLPKPQIDGGRPLMQALKDRKSSRAFSSEKLQMQVLSNLLWAAFGVNRQNGPFGGPGRTAASASNSVCRC